MKVKNKIALILISLFPLQYSFAQNEEEENYLSIIEEPVQPEGGMKAFYKYVGANLKYPKKAKKEGIEGKVFVQFIVHPDGFLTEVTVVKGIHKACDKEALRIFKNYNKDKNAPKWHYGLSRGKPKTQKIVVPIYFEIE